MWRRVGAVRNAMPQAQRADAESPACVSVYARAGPLERRRQKRGGGARRPSQDLLGLHTPEQGSGTAVVGRNLVTLRLHFSDAPSPRLTADEVPRSCPGPCYTDRRAGGGGARPVGVQQQAVALFARAGARFFSAGYAPGAPPALAEPCGARPAALAEPCGATAATWW